MRAPLSSIRAYHAGRTETYEEQKAKLVCITRTDTTEGAARRGSAHRIRTRIPDGGRRTTRFGPSVHRRYDVGRRAKRRSSVRYDAWTRDCQPPYETAAGPAQGTPRCGRTRRFRHTRIRKQNTERTKRKGTKLTIRPDAYRTHAATRQGKRSLGRAHSKGLQRRYEDQRAAHALGYITRARATPRRLGHAPSASTLRCIPCMDAKHACPPPPRDHARELSPTWKRAIREKRTYL